MREPVILYIGERGQGHSRGDSQRVGLCVKLMSSHEDAGIQRESVEYMLEEIKLLKFRKVAHENQSEPSSPSQPQAHPMPP